MNRIWACWICAILGCAVTPAASPASAATPEAPQKPGITSLTNNLAKYTVPPTGYAILKRADIEAVVVDNRAVDNAILPGHRAGYNGVASLKHRNWPQNLFVPAFAGLNFEHIHDGTVQPRETLFEPRNAPMELRLIDEHTAEIYQKPTPHWGLESCHRYHLLDDGTIELTFECIPRKAAFKNGYIGLFWASYIHQPESLDIHFRGRAEGSKGQPQWVRGVSPDHGIDAMHLSLDDNRLFPHDEQFPLKLVFTRSKWRYANTWYYGLSHGMAFVQMFRNGDGIRISQSPNGAGDGNPAWDFQCLIENCELGKLYRIVMRAKYMPFERPEAIENAIRPHWDAIQVGSN